MISIPTPSRSGGGQKSSHSSRKPDYSCTCIPSLNTTSNGLPFLTEENSDKVATLAESFFPPLSASSHILPNQTTPTPLHNLCFFSRTRIRQVIHSLSPYKAPGPDKIPNIVLMKCMDAPIDNLFFIFRAVFELKVYHPNFLKSITLVLHKIGKTTYCMMQQNLITQLASPTQFLKYF
jgi:hypothetical protein